MARRLFGVLRSAWVRRAVLAAAIAILLAAAVDKRHALRSAVSEIGVVGIGASVLSAAAAVALQWLAWHVIMLRLGSRLAVPRSASIFAISSVGKYLPGGVWTTVLQVEYAADAGTARRSTVLASAASMLITLIVGALIGLGQIATAFRSVGAMAWILPVALVPALLLLHPPRLSALAARFAPDPRVDRSNLFSNRTVMFATALTAASWLAFGVHLCLLTAGEVPLLQATSGYALAWTLGFLFLIAPAGAGVRDVVLVAVLGRYVADDVAVATALLSRAVLTVVDLLLAAGGLALRPAGLANRLRVNTRSTT